MSRLVEVTNVFELAEALLQYCRKERLAITRVLASRAGQSELRRLRDTYYDGVTSSWDVTISRAQRTELQGALGVLAEDRLGIEVRALALALDDEFAAYFVGLSQKRGNRRVRPDSAFPVPAVDLSKVLPGRRYTTRVENAPNELSPDELPHLRLGASGGILDALAVELSYSDFLEDALGGEELNLAALQINDSLDQLVWDVDVTDQTFGNFRARSGDEQIVKVRDAIELAVTAQATVAVLPELVLDDTTYDAVIEDLVNQPAPAVVLAGSRHRINDIGAYVNEATLLIRGPLGASYAYRQNKLVPFSRLPHQFEGQAVFLREGIDAGRSLTLHLTDGFVLGVLICSDLLDAKVAELIAHLGVNLLLVCAMTEKVDRFQAHVDLVVATNQAFVVLANAPRKWPTGHQVFCLFGQPVEGGQVSWEYQAAAPGCIVRPSAPHVEEIIDLSLTASGGAGKIRVIA